MITCPQCKTETDLPQKGSLYLDPETGISYRVTDLWWHIGRMTPHLAYLEPQYPSGGGHRSTIFSTQLPEGAVLVWSPS
jgi:hypothetical protein